MSKAAYSKQSGYRKVPAPPRAAEEDVVEDYDEDEYDDEEVYEDGYADAEQTSGGGSGLFSSPARTITLVFSVLLLFAVVAYAAWLLGTNSKPTSTTTTQSNTTGKLIPVPQISNSNVAYTSKPAGLAEAPSIGSIPPNFQWVDKSGKTMTLESLRGKPVLLNFWGTWCPPCRAEMPEMQKIYDQRQGDVTFLGVSMGPRDEPLGVSQFVQLSNYTWDFIHDSDQGVMARYQVTGLPSSYFIDSNGVIQSILVGGANAQMIEESLNKAQQ
jgi:peroxiredoxin